MKIKLDKLTITEVEVEIPERCPKCGSVLTEANEDCEFPLKEDQYSGSEQACVMGDDGVADYDLFEAADCGTCVVGYRCGECNYQLASTE